jgi:hypothetical protein
MKEAKYLRLLLLDLANRNQTFRSLVTRSFPGGRDERASFAPSRLRTIMEAFGNSSEIQQQSQNLAVTMLPRNGLIQCRIASVAPITMSIQTPQTDIVTLHNSSWQCIQAQTKDYLEEIAETMLWLGSLHLQQGPFQVSYGIFSLLDLQLTLF